MTVPNLEQHGIKNVAAVHGNLTTPALYEEIVCRREGLIAHLGPVVVRTGAYTGRSPKDKFIVYEPTSAEKIAWGDQNRPLDPEKFAILHARLLAFLQGRELYVQDCYAGAHPEHRLPIRVITTQAWQSLFARNLFVRIKDKKELPQHRPQFTIISAPDFHAVPELDGTNSEACVIVNFAERLILIGGTSYGGEIKKSVFTILNYYLPQQEVLSMHCSANMGEGRDVAIFFGLSGTGKTTLSADPERRLIGDDEHGWWSGGVFNFEGGCYAKVIRLNPKAEPEIYECTRRFGTILENVGIDLETRRLDLDDDSLTENTRAAYPITHLKNIVPDGLGDHPRNIFMLTCDAFGVLPPLARLTPEQATYHFLSGYTAKVAGTERGMGNEPSVTFSTCFGAPFMALPAAVYARLFWEKVERHKVTCWLVNTGWTGGPFGVGHRMDIAHTRALLRAALSGMLDEVPFHRDPTFGLYVPDRVRWVPPEVLRPRDTWSDKEAYDRTARELIAKFAANFEEYAPLVEPAVREAGPGV
ncbi:MAG: phosphoenolpyruvate carboxykinase (ATP) [Desulfobaccales bacterium]